MSLKGLIFTIKMTVTTIIIVTGITIAVAHFILFGWREIWEAKKERDIYKKATEDDF